MTAPRIVISNTPTVSTWAIEVAHEIVPAVGKWFLRSDPVTCILIQAELGSCATPVHILRPLDPSPPTCPITSSPASTIPSRAVEHNSRWKSNQASHDCLEVARSGCYVNQDDGCVENSPRPSQQVHRDFFPCSNVSRSGGCSSPYKTPCSTCGTRCVARSLRLRRVHGGYREHE